MALGAIAWAGGCVSYFGNAMAGDVAAAWTALAIAYAGAAACIGGKVAAWWHHG